MKQVSNKKLNPDTDEVKDDYENDDCLYAAHKVILTAARSPFFRILTDL